MAEPIPAEVVITQESRKPEVDPTLGIEVEPDRHGEPPHRLVTIGDSLTHGFQSGSVFHTDISYPAIIAYELGWLDSFRYPSYDGFGGLPLNIELLLRELEQSCGRSVDWWEVPLALFRARQFMGDVESYWEQGPGSVTPPFPTINHNLAMYGWDLRDALSATGAECAAKIKVPKDNFFKQVVQNSSERAALRVYPMAVDPNMTVFAAAAALGAEAGDDKDGIETLIVFLGANNVLPSVVQLKVAWSGDDYANPAAKGAYTVWRPSHFAAELGEVAEQVRRIKARHVIWCTVPHVTIVPLARGVGGGKVALGSRYFPYYTRPWITDAQFTPTRDPHLTADEARAVDCAIDQYNDAITDVVRKARGDQDQPRDWYLLDVAGILDRLAQRRYIDDPLARPSWWTPYPLPPQLDALSPRPDSQFISSDGTRRDRGGLFSLDGVHPTTVGYGILAQEFIKVMHLAGVEFRNPDDSCRPGTPAVDFDRVIRRDTLVTTPPAVIDSSLGIVSWADEALDVVRRTLTFHF
jgi:lysophospholipase L1-like esterase